LTAPATGLSPQPPRENEDVVIVGAGIIGICCAALLAEAGRRVLVLDRTGVCVETSSGNAGAFAFSDILPLAQKGMWRQLPRWLSDPLGPLSISPAYLPQLLPWLVRFLAAGMGDGKTALAAQAGLMRLARSEWLALIDRAGLRPMLREAGSLELYESDAEFERALPDWRARSDHGIAFEHVSGARLADLQPGLSPRFGRGTFVPDWKTVDDPMIFGKAVWAHAEKLGAGFRKANVIDSGLEGETLSLRLDSGEMLRPSVLVNAAGAWSKQLASRFGDRIPLDTERGYNTTLPVEAFDVRRQLIFGGHGFVITPLSTGLRIGGAVEFAGLTKRANFARAKAMVSKATDFLPGLRTEGGREWMGFRPSLPDSLPVIGASRTSSRVIHAFGHGHLGKTQAAATARLVRDLVLQQDTAIDLAPFSAQRFGWFGN
jgi:D-amino-acid dehydrogenase